MAWCPRIREEVKTSGADLVWLRASTRKQERWMGERHHVAAPALVRVGAAAGFHAWRHRQAPRRMQPPEVECLLRLVVEPHSPWGGYLSSNPLVAALLRRPLSTT